MGSKLSGDVPNSLFSLDIETACAIEGCLGQCKHALIPHQSKISVVGIHNDSFSKAFWDLSDLAIWLASHPDFKFVAHNGSFDLKHLQYHGINLSVDQWEGDSYLLAALKKGKIPEQWLVEYEVKRKEFNKDLPKGKRHRKAGQLSLKTLAPYFLKVDPFWEATLDHADETYVLKDAQYTWELYKKLSKYVKAQGTWDFYTKYQQPWARTMFQLGGVELDLPGLYQLETESIAKIKDLKEQLETLWHHGAEAFYQKRLQKVADKYSLMTETALAKLSPSAELGRHEQIVNKYNKLHEAAQLKVLRGLNIDSPQQMLWLFKEFYGWNVKSLDGTTSTGKTLLQKRADEGHEDAKLFLQYKKARKLLSSFIAPYKELQLQGKLYPSFNSFGARTGRTSCQNPNLQQCPPEIRRLIRAPDGYKLIIYDMSAIEPRLIAYFSEEKPLVELFQQPNADFHALTTVKYGLVPEGTELAKIKKEYPDERAAGKEAGLATLYGAGKIRLKLALQKRGINKSEDQCGEMIYRLRKGFPSVTAYKKKLDQMAEQGQAVKSIFGMPVWYPNKDDVYMMTFNTQIQGSASQLVVEAARRISQQFQELSMKSRVCLAIHDELVCLAPDEEVLAAEKLVINCMTGYNLKTKYGNVPLTVEGHVSQNWVK